MTHVPHNPIIIREMRSRMRGRRAFIFITLYLMLLSCMAGSVYTLIYSENVAYNPYNQAAPAIEYGPVIGKAIFSGIVLLLITIISFIAPGFTAGAIAGEHERQTYPILQITPLRPVQIVWGKLGSVFIFLLLLIAASLPIQSLAFLFGGVAPGEVIIAALGLTVTALAFGTLGLFISSLVRRTILAIVVTYTLGIPFIYGMPFMIFYIASITFSVVTVFDDPSLPIIFFAVYGLGFLASINPFSSAIMTGIAAENGRGYFFFSETIGPVTLWLVSPWLIYVIFYSLLTIILFWLTVQQVGRINNK